MRTFLGKVFNIIIDEIEYHYLNALRVIYIDKFLVKVKHTFETFGE